MALPGRRRPDAEDSGSFAAANPEAMLGVRERGGNTRGVREQAGGGVGVRERWERRDEANSALLLLVLFRRSLLAGPRK